MTLLIKNGRVLDPDTGRDGIFDLLVEGERIVRVEETILCSAAQVIDAKGCYVMPGLIDMHVHLREPGFEQKETIRTGSLAAAKGGFTTICPMPNTKPAMDSPDRVAAFMEKVKKDSIVHILPIGAVTKGLLGMELTDITGMKEQGICGISEDGYSVMDEELYLEGMKQAARADVLVMAHCEDKTLVQGGVMNAGEKAKEFSLPGITNEVEDVIVERDIRMAGEMGTRLHLCHCSTKGSVAILREGKKKGISVTGEVCPHHFTMSEEEITEDHGRFKMNPPLRKKEDVFALKEALRDGVMDVISTDHAPHTEEEKNTSMKTAPFGIVGLETAVPLTITELVRTGYLTPMDMARCMSFHPAKILRIPKGSLREGAIADITIINPELCYEIDKETFVSLGHNTPFHGKKVYGAVLATVVNGNIVYFLEGDKYD